MRYIIEDYRADLGKMCLYSSIRNILSHQKLDVSEGDAFFLADGLNMVYHSDTNSIGNAMSSIVKLREYNLFDVDFSYIDKTEGDFWDNVLKVLTKNNIVLLMANTKEFKFHDVYVVRKENFVHAILLYGIDTDNDIAFIGDVNIREDSGGITNYQGPTSLKVIKESSYGFCCIGVKKDVILDRKDILKCVIKGLERYLKGGINEDNTSYGVQAVKEYVDNFEKVMILDDSAFEQACFKIHYSITVHSVNLGLDYMIDFLNSDIKLKDDYYHELVSSLQVTKREWTKAALLILKIGKMHKKDRINEAIDLCKNVIEKQNSVFNNVLEYLKIISAN